MNHCMNLIGELKTILLRGDERTRRMKHSTISMLIIKGLSILVSMAYMPLMLSAIDRTDYGVLLTMTSIVNWVAMLDIGLGNGLRNAIAKNLAQNECEKARENISSCYAALALYVSIILIAFVSIAPLLNWQSILNAPDNSESELHALVTIVFISFSIQFVVNLITSILYACQMPAITSYIMLTTQILNFVLVYMLVHIFEIHSILEIGVVTCFSTPIVLIIFSFFLFSKRLAHIAPSFKHIHLKSVNSILSVGLKFFVIQIISIVLFQANNIIITQTVGPEAVVTYNIAYKYIGLVVVIFNIIITPIWSAATDAYVREDFEWMTKTLAYIRSVFFCVFIFGLVMFAISPWVYKIWLGRGVIEIPYSITGLVLTYCLFEILYKTYGTFINGIGKLHLQMIITSVVAVIYIPLAILFGRRWGLPGVLIANTIVFMVNYIWSRMQCNRIINQTAVGLWNR